MEALDLLREFLKANGYDGFYAPGECACNLEGLCWCENLENITAEGECRPGVYHPVPAGSDCSFYIGDSERDKILELEATVASLAHALQVAKEHGALHKRGAEHLVECAFELSAKNAKLEARERERVALSCGIVSEEEARYEAELSRAAAILQDVHPIGQVKHIGLLEVAAALSELLDEWSITGTPGGREEAAIREILTALAEARARHPQWQADVIHSAAVLAEEAGEVVKAALDLTYFNAPNHQQLKKELAQVGAMAVRMLVNLPLCEIHPDLINEVAK